MLNYTNPIPCQSDHLILLFTLGTVLWHTPATEVFPEAPCSQLTRTGNNFAVRKGKLTISGMYDMKNPEVLCYKSMVTVFAGDTEQHSGNKRLSNNH